jgi:hypothetical protein
MSSPAHAPPARLTASTQVEEDSDEEDRPQQRQNRNKSDDEADADDGDDMDLDDHQGQSADDQMAKKLVRYALSCEYSRTTIKRDGIRERGKSYEGLVERD